jgi:hypothetical protein
MLSFHLSSHSLFVTPTHPTYQRYLSLQLNTTPFLRGHPISTQTNPSSHHGAHSLAPLRWPPRPNSVHCICSATTSLLWNVSFRSKNVSSRLLPHVLHRKQQHSGAAKQCFNPVRTRLPVAVCRDAGCPTVLRVWLWIDYLSKATVNWEGV